MRFDPVEIREKAKQDFESAWREGSRYLYQPQVNQAYPRLSVAFGRPHPVFETVQRLREAYLRLGFEEVLNPLFVDEQEVYRQFGPEAMAVLDRCFYLAGLPRPDVGMSEEKARMLKEILGIDDSGVEEVRQTLHSYKRGEIEGDDLVAVISQGLEVPDSSVVQALEEVFPEFKELKPVPSSNTLRSHMTSGWFLTLSELKDYRPLPFRLFSVDRCFRREQQEDASRLMAYHSASCVVAGDEVSVDTGKAVARALLEQFGFQDFAFRPDEKRSKYYTPDTQTEVFAFHPDLADSKYSDGWVEIATFGIYSPTALAQYDIPFPVMNLGLGVERLAMLLYHATDIRVLAYPQFHYKEKWHLTDSELCRLITLETSPSTPTGMEIQQAIARVCQEHGDTESPCEFTAWQGILLGREIEVKVVEPEENTKLCGPAAHNEVVVYQNNILGIPETPRWEKTLQKGCRTGIKFIDALAAKAAREIEKAAILDQDSETRVKIVRTPAEINLKIDPTAQRYITGLKKKIDIRGPVFTTVKMEIKNRVD